VGGGVWGVLVGGGGGLAVLWGGGGRGGLDLDMNNCGNATRQPPSGSQASSTPGD